MGFADMLKRFVEIVMEGTLRLGDTKAFAIQEIESGTKSSTSGSTEIFQDTRKN